MYANENIRLTNRGLGNSPVGRVRRLSPRDGNLRLVREKVNEGNVDSSKTKRKQKGET